MLRACGLPWSRRDEPVMGRISVVASRLTQAGTERWEKGGQAELGTNVGRQVYLGKGGKEMAEGAGFSRLFAPFPGISHLFPLGFFLPGGAGSQKSEGEAGRNYVGKSADNYGKFHESSRKFAQIRPVNPRCYALLRVRPILDANLASQARHEM